jgi:hypothetical protein
MGIGIRQIYVNTADQVITSSTALETVTGLPVPIAAGQSMKVKWWVKVTVGATGGVRAQVTVPAAGAVYSTSIRLNNTVAPSQTIATQQAQAAFTNALANAGTHWLEIEAVIVNGANAGNVELQMGQNTSDVASLTILRGATCEVVIF